jgi:hypothetical protein
MDIFSLVAATQAGCFRFYSFGALFEVDARDCSGQMALRTHKQWGIITDFGSPKNDSFAGLKWRLNRQPSIPS